MIFYMGVKLLTLTLKEEVTYKLLGRTSGPGQTTEFEKLQNRVVSYLFFFTNITGDLLCKTGRVGNVVHIEQIRNACMHPFTSLLTHSLTPRNRVHLEKLPSSQLVKKFPEFYGT